MAAVITPVAMLSYPYIDQPQKAQNPGDEPKFSAAFVFAKDADLTQLKQEVIAAAEARWPGKGAEMLRKGQLRSPFRYDAEAKGYPEGSVFINARTKTKPQVVYAHKDPATGKAAIMPAEKIKQELYPGCFVRASVVPFAYDKSGNKGISFALNNIQKVRDGERIDGRAKAEDEFDAILDAPDVADLSDII